MDFEFLKHDSKAKRKAPAYLSEGGGLAIDIQWRGSESGHQVRHAHYSFSLTFG